MLRGLWAPSAYGEQMRWDDLFADLQAQLHAAAETEAQWEVAELAETEIARTTMADRWRARRGQDLQVRLGDGSDRDGTVVDAATEWFVLARGGRRILVPGAAVVLVRPLGPSAPPPGRVERALGLGHVLRAMAHEHLAVGVCTLAGTYRGRLVRVGADHVDVATDGGVVTVAWRALVSVESGP